jgi:GNAT superfamily N-acetyltransferase
MFIREAHIKDIPSLKVVRNAVLENTLSDPSLISDADYQAHILNKGKAWLCEIKDQVAGFVMVDLSRHNVWALFVHPEHEKKGIGLQLHDVMLDWYFLQTDTHLRLGTEVNTRAESFYRKAGWKAIGHESNGEILFEMTLQVWQSKRR